MKKFILTTFLMLASVLMGTLAFGNPALLPKHPGYPMGATEDPVMGVPTANDPGRSAPPAEVAIEQAAKFHDAQASNPMREYRPNVIHGEEEGASSASTKNQKEIGR